MNNFREMPLVRVLLVALVFVVCFGGFGGELAFARVEMEIEMEGDPGDSYDVYSGGSGGSGGDSESEPQNQPLSNDDHNALFLLYVNSDGSMVFVQPIVENGMVFFEIIYKPSCGRQK